MTHTSKREVITHYRKEYRSASKKHKTQLLKTIIEVTGYSRKYAIGMLRYPDPPAKRITRHRESRYAHLVEALQFVWMCADCLCGKRLQAVMPLYVESLRRFGHLKIGASDAALLLQMSAATIDRLLAPVRKKIGIRGVSTTKPGSMLKNSIPMRTFAEWNQSKPGFLQIDLVAHCGERNQGEYINTLDMTDVCTGWTVCAAFMGKSFNYCSEALAENKHLFPFEILGIHSDNGGEFINAHLQNFCQINKLTFTRNRPYKKNDSCYVEQKNWDVVRKKIGYNRFDQRWQLKIINEIYATLALYQNYFQPSQKLINKHRDGAKLIRSYDVPQTPAQRLIARDDIKPEVKRRLQQFTSNIDPYLLLKQIHDLLDQLA